MCPLSGGAQLNDLAVVVMVEVRFRDEFRCGPCAGRNNLFTEQIFEWLQTEETSLHVYLSTPFGHTSALFASRRGLFLFFYSSFFLLS